MAAHTLSADFSGLVLGLPALGVSGSPGSSWGTDTAHSRAPAASPELKLPPPHTQVGTNAMDSPLLKYSAKDYFFKAALCHFCIDMLNAKVSATRPATQGLPCLPGALGLSLGQVTSWQGVSLSLTSSA